MNRFIIAVAGTLVLICLISFRWSGEPIPKTWDMEAIKKFHLPPPDSSVKVEYAPEAYYNSLPEHVIFKTYPVYLKEFERPGYLDSLRALEPEVAFDPQKVKTQEDWVKAGELVFNFPVASYRLIKGEVSHLEASQFKMGAGKFTADGIYPVSRYIISEKGKLMIGSQSCASCHTRVMDSGLTIAGAQGNVYNPTGFVKGIQSGSIPFAVIQQGVKQLSHAPWSPETIRSMPSNKEEFVNSLLGLPGGVAERQGYAFLYPLSVPSLIGLKDIKYLDNTGLMRHEGPGDLMRYAAFNQGMDMLTRYDNYIPLGKNDNSELPLPTEWSHPFGYVGKRYTDAQLYALTQYIYSLKPPLNPNQFPKELIAKGKLVFKKAGCITCHTPPLYTNNKLTPVNGFEPPADHFKKYDIFNVSVETDSVSALYSRRATGYYKVPSLRGLWFKGAFFHNGNLTTLEEVLDPKRLQPDYIPSGFKPPHLKTMVVKGHLFGLDLSEKDKKALIAFLKTL